MKKRVKLPKSSAGERKVESAVAAFERFAKAQAKIKDARKRARARLAHSLNRALTAAAAAGSEQLYLRALKATIPLVPLIDFPDGNGTGDDWVTAKIKRLRRRTKDCKKNFPPGKGRENCLRVAFLKALLCL
ncbi:MAG: hypothetical protein HYY79_08075 [Betaproteobacteria bacterium]|nr:hypothetical protein [Betaproteobacteria bacterium]